MNNYGRRGIYETACIMGSSFLAITDISNNHHYNYNSAMQL